MHTHTDRLALCGLSRCGERDGQPERRQLTRTLLLLLLLLASLPGAIGMGLFLMLVSLTAPSKWTTCAVVAGEGLGAFGGVSLFAV
jgi:hypothetical protein